MVAIALYTRWFHRWGLLAGRAIGMDWGLWMLHSIPNLTTAIAALELGRLSILGWEPFAGSTLQIYPGFLALVGNLVVATVFILVLRLIRVFNGTDETEPTFPPTLSADQTPVAAE
jgi:SSS family solute:Na+ symporter